MSDQDWQNKLAAQNVFAQRRNQAIAQAAANGGGAWTAWGDDGSFAAGAVDKNGNPAGTGGGSAANSSNSNSFLGSNSNSNLFGNIGELGSTFDKFADSATNRAKDWAQFQLGLNQQQGEQDYGFRNREAQRDFGFRTAEAAQQIEGNRSLENLRQASETDRLQRSLNSQQTMQQSDFQNQTQQRAQQAALARVGFRGR